MVNGVSYLGRYMEFLCENKSHVASGLDHKYEEGPRKDSIIEALILWKFINLHLIRYGALDWQQRHDDMIQVLPALVSRLAKALLLLETMPTPAIRKIIWAYNIDFMSPESFLRRLNIEQIEAIEINYHELWQDKKVPESFRIRKSPMAYEEIMAAKFEPESRYMNAGAMSYNLLGWDFGFNAYPRGTEDDYRIIEISPLRFLSIKNHADDFIVNQEDGKYFRLYRSPRSNYVYRPKRNVVLSTHICPGFWYTILAHFLFWFFSPACFIAGVAIAASPDISLPWYGWILLGAHATVTPLWLLLAAFKYAAISWFTGPGVALFEWLERHEDKILKVIQPLGAYIILFMVAFVLTYVFLVLNSFWDWPSATAVVITVTLFLLHKAVNSKALRRKRYCGHDNFSAAAGIGLLLVILKIIFDLRQPLWNFIWLVLVKCGEAIAGAFMSLIDLGFLALLLVSPIITAVFIAFMMWYSEKAFNDRKREKIYRTMETMLKLIMLGLFAVAVVLSVQAYQTIDYRSGITQIMIIMAAALLLLQIPMSFALALDNRKAGKIASYISEYWLSSEKRVIGRKAVKNSWLYQSTPARDREDRIAGIASQAQKFFRKKEFLKEAIISTLINGTEKGLKFIAKYEHKLRQLDEDSRLAVYCLMVKGMRFDPALRLARQDQERQELEEREAEEEFERFKASCKRFFYVIFYPVIKLFQGVVWLVVKTIEFGKTFYRLYELFNKRCPYVAQKRTLKYDI